MAKNPTALVVDDEESIRFAFQRFFEGRNWRVATAATAAEGLAAFNRDRPQVVFLDIRLGDSNGLDVLEAIRRQDERAAVIVITAYGSMDAVARAVRNRAYDILIKPLDLEDAFKLACQCLEKPRPAPPLKDEFSIGEKGSPVVVGSSPRMQEVYKRIGKVAQSDCSVLIAGQTGTGKDLFACAIHWHSDRRDKPFIAVNCGALPESLIESELFGYVRGAFTGADSDRPGRFEAADGGTLFLDEVGEVPLNAQVKLLRAIDTKTIERLGSVKPINVDVRIIAATNRDLQKAIAEGQFRQDLYYRLAVVQIELPALGERKEDIVPLARHFLAELSRESRIPEISLAAQEMLANYQWPGNVRELRNAIEHAAIACRGPAVMPEHLPDAVRHARPAGPDAHDLAALDAFVDSVWTADAPPLYPPAEQHLQRAMIRRAMAQCDGNQTKVAQLLGMHRNTLRQKIAELGLESECKEE
ncbi:MAG: sigma-54-dependent Fis family transcriptional regulator [Planctomycetes bacterium]|nr:sigma-54-dependent Fis family transcriptional regulator [Planctomycetota bacterium]